MPNFLVIGAGKAGSTSLDEYLKQHPQIYVSPVKEPNFFALEGQRLDFKGLGAETRINSWSVTDIEKYRALFKDVKEQKAIGEVSPLYLYSPKAPDRIKHYIPDVKLIAILRHPADRAYSAYLWLFGQEREQIKDFAKALEAEESRIQSNWEWIWHYKNLGFYYPQLKRYYDRFARQQIKVYLFEDLKNNGSSLIKEISNFLEVDDIYMPDTSIKYAYSVIPPKNKAVQDFLTQQNPLKYFLKSILPANIRKPLSAKVYKQNMTQPLKLTKEMRQQLIEVYREDILKLQDLIQRDLSSWL
ncbi:sulfotransferase domain-containing protein [Argonema antarcticum]|nr:sulfotransferase domain-containing protein [Argonema antarcticum]